LAGAGERGRCCWSGASSDTISCSKSTKFHRRTAGGTTRRGRAGVTLILAPLQCLTPRPCFPFYLRSLEPRWCAIAVRHDRAANLAEVLAMLSDHRLPVEEAARTVDILDLRVAPHNRGQSAALRRTATCHTRSWITRSSRRPRTSACRRE